MYPGTVGVLLHAQTCQLVEHGGDRDRDHESPASGPTHRRRRLDAARDRSLGSRANARQAKIHWTFTISAARVKLKKLYPVQLRMTAY